MITQVAVNYVEKFLESEFTDITKSMYPTLFLNVESGDPRHHLQSTREAEKYEAECHSAEQ